MRLRQGFQPHDAAFEQYRLDFLDRNGGCHRLLIFASFGVPGLVHGSGHLNALEPHTALRNRGALHIHLNVHANILLMPMSGTGPSLNDPIANHPAPPFPVPQIPVPLSKAGPRVAIKPEPRWPVLAAFVATGSLFYFLPSALTIGPDWLVLFLMCLFLVPASISHHTGHLLANQIFGYLSQATITLALVSSLTLLVLRLPRHLDSPEVLLRSAAGLWVANVVVFAAWYWRLDAGGPHQRDLEGSHTDGAFLFPQMTLPPELRKAMGEDQWRPGFVDYLFLAFNTNTAFSPTDVPVLSRWAKVLMMLQASISLATLAIIAARAVNIL
jgi:hypothetical protein